MRNRYQKPQHEVFVKAMIEHNDPTKAYSIAYPNVSLASAQAAGSRLYARPDIRARITPALEEKYRAIHKEAMILAEEAGRLRAEEVCRKRMFLAMVVRCEARKRKAYKTKEGLLIVQEDPSHDTVIRAIELDLRLQDGYPRKDLIEKQFNRILRDLSPSPRHGIVFTAEELMKDEPDVKLMSESQIELIRLKNTDANEKTSLHRQQFITNSEPQIKLIRLNKTDADEKTSLHEQQFITNSVANEKTVTIENQANQIDQSDLRFRQEEKTPLHRQLSITSSEPQIKPIRLNKTDADEKTGHNRQLSITNSISHEDSATIEYQANQINQSDLRFRQEEKTSLYEQQLITTEPSELMSADKRDVEPRINSKHKLPAILKSNMRTTRKKNGIHRLHSGQHISKTG
jgi:hypothetical protein